jgi:cation diffusion facilitator family transporter
MASRSESKFVIYAALAGNFLVAATKFVAAAWTGSSSMLSEGVHSLVDTSNEGLLLYGLRRSQRQPDSRHPLGYGRELYFWSFIVALMLFALGAGVSVYEGIAHIMEPREVEDVAVNYVVLALAALFEGGSWIVALRAFRRTKGEQTYWQAIRRSKDPPTFIVLFEDSAALIGIAIAAIGIFSASHFQRPAFDGVASILIGLVLAATAAILARESKGLLIGERASEGTIASILSLARSHAGVAGAEVAITVHMAPDQIVVALNVEFDDALTAPQIEATVAAMEEKIRARHPEVVSLFVKPQSAGRAGRAPPSGSGERLASAAS